MDLLRLDAVDADDLAILSAHCQDAVLRIDDLQFLPREQRFVLAMNRFVWEKAGGHSRFSLFRRREYERRQAVLSFSRVSTVQKIGVDSAAKDQVLALLAMRFVPGELPSGSIELVFAGGSAIRLDVECVEARLADLGPAWSTGARPDHDKPDKR
ncbi:hypothetical protein Sa4125_03000 [Aureimonas sp. SA4125]|uniref:DUF2948 family protein n=1 Tax=Aureimonas sp. SA4125 TaxID=2826993 RepID=UPI001CC37B5B|nr:DUF2948 family protein [Aureimonas sp. SA4125]BDA82758.1 hypothetical protein Sa4125_03000 [Aureimonas sp. SA4125]